MSRFVITGIDRIGIRQTSKLLSSLNIKCENEKIFIPRLKINQLSFQENYGEASCFAAPFLDKLPSETVVLHQTTEPLIWINNLLKVSSLWDSGYTNFIDDHCGFFRWKDGYHPIVDMKLYVKWNNMIEKSAQNSNLVYTRYKLEDLDFAKVIELTNLINKPLDSKITSLPPIDEVAPTKIDPAYIPVTWETLPQCAELEAFKAMAIKYGYPVG